MSKLLNNYRLVFEVVNSELHFCFLWLLNNKGSREEYKENLKRLCCSPLISISVVVFLKTPLTIVASLDVSYMTCSSYITWHLYLARNIISLTEVTIFS